MGRLEQEIGHRLRQMGLTLAVVESATGGLISHRITNVPGSSDYYRGSVTAYSNEVKIKIVGVKAETINQYGAVSSPVAEEMARGGRRILAADNIAVPLTFPILRRQWDTADRDTLLREIAEIIGFPLVLSIICALLC